MDMMPIRGTSSSAVSIQARNIEWGGLTG